MKKRIRHILAYATVIILLLLATKCEKPIKITTPQKDAHYIAELAATVETEDELKTVEGLARKYELAYRKSANGATALKFRKLCAPIIDEASSRCAEAANAEMYLNEEHQKLVDKLDLLDAAWQYQITTAEADLAKIAAIEESVADIYTTIDSLSVVKGNLGVEIVEKGYPQDMLDKIGKLTERIASEEAKIAGVLREAEIIRYAYKLQGKPLVVESYAFEAEAAEVCDGEYCEE